MTASRDLRSFLSSLESAGRLKRVSKPVDRSWEIACLSRWSLESTPPDQAYAILFENVTGHEQPVAVNLFTTREMYALALGASPEAILERWSEAVAKPLPPAVAEAAPVQDIVDSGDGIRLGSLPAPVWTPGRDAGPYLSAGVVITKDPETGVQNVASYRVQIHGDRSVGVFFGSRRQHGAMHRARWTERKEPMPVAIVVGAPPAVLFAAAAKTAYGVDEMTLAGGLAGEPVEVVRGKTVDLLIPARAECVIEGFMPADGMIMEGPFGEALGYMNDAAPAPFVNVTAVTRRRDAIHHGYLQQLPPSDGHLVMEIGVLGPLWHYLTRQLGFTGIRDLAIARGSAGVSQLLVQIAGDAAGKAAAVGKALAKLNFGQKIVCLLDEDVDIRDPETVNWALSSRVDPSRDVKLVDGTPTYQLDPSVIRRAEADGTPLGEPPYASSLMIVDATVKGASPALSLPEREFMERALAGWGDTGLPPIAARLRLRRLLERGE